MGSDHMGDIVFGFLFNLLSVFFEAGPDRKIPLVVRIMAHVSVACFVGLIVGAVAGRFAGDHVAALWAIAGGLTYFVAVLTLISRLGRRKPD